MAVYAVLQPLLRALSWRMHLQLAASPRNKRGKVNLINFDPGQSDPVSANFGNIRPAVIFDSARETMRAAQ